MNHSILYKFRKWMLPLKRTILHPQWLIWRSGGKTYDIAQYMAGMILDIGCGNRFLEKYLKPSDNTYIGLDYPPTHTKGYTGRPDLFGDGQQLPFRPESFNTVIALDVLEHLPSPNQCIQEAARVLQVGGRLILQTPFLYPLHDMPYDFQRWTLPGLETMVQREGFTVTKCQIFGTPCETSAALATISLAKAVLDSIEQRSPAILLIPLLIAGIPLINLLGWLLGRLLPTNNFLPLGYRLICTKLV